jgi:cytochrome c oxidase subunit 3
MMKNQENYLLKERVNRNLLYVGIFSIVMLFSGLTSAYIVRQADGQWLKFSLPGMFWVSSAVILVSSITMHWALYSVRRAYYSRLVTGVALTLVLGIVFCITQFLSWGQLVESGIYFAGKTANPSGSFLYALSGLHLIHIVSGILSLGWVLISALRKKYTAERHSGVRNAALYWHFLDGLWIYLFVFLIFMQ